MDNPHDAETGGLDTRGFVQRFLYYASALCLIGVVGIVFYATMARYFFHAPPFWGEEVPVVLFVWMGFLAAGLAIVSGWNVRVQAIELVFRPRVVLWLRLFTHTIVVGFLAALLWHSQDVVELAMFGRLQATGWPRWVVVAALPTGLVLMLGFQVVLWLRTLRALRSAG
jgi:TRAP-type C4-dicarboxylate transport system permease small subunit